MSGKYDDIINLPHHESEKHPHMSMHNRAAQFSPFAALSGYDAAVKETARLTQQKTELTDDERLILDEKFKEIMLSDKRKANINYFEPDLLKDGGSYKTVTDVIKKFDKYAKVLILASGLCIALEDIYDINSVDDEEL